MNKAEGGHVTDWLTSLPPRPMPFTQNLAVLVSPPEPEPQVRLSLTEWGFLQPIGL